MRLAKLTALTLVMGLGLPALAQDGQDPVVATVDGAPILRSDVERTLSELPEQYHQMPLDVLFDALRDRAIDTALLSGEADRRELSEDPAVKAALADAERRILRNRLIETTVERAVTEDALEAAYETRKADPAFSREEVKARHILVETEETAKELIVELEEGADFASLAAEHSTGPSGPNGGDLGYFEKEQMVGPFADAAFAMEAGAFSAEPVETRFGWHVILVEDRRTTTPSFEDTRVELEQELGRLAVTDLLERLRADAAIERFDLDGSALPETE